MKKLFIIGALMLSTLGLASPGSGMGHGFGPGPVAPGLRGQALVTARQLVMKYRSVVFETRNQIFKAYYQRDFKLARQLQNFGYEVMMQTSRIRRRVIMPLRFGHPNSVVRGNMHRIETHGSKKASKAWHAVINKPQQLWDNWSQANQNRKKLHQITEALR